MFILHEGCFAATVNDCRQIHFHQLKAIHEIKKTKQIQNAD
jgi:hypothetical protein